VVVSERRTTSLVLAALTGALFGSGLVISGMTQPSKVIGFLDFTRGWDPTLAFVMGGAVVVYAIAVRLVVRRSPHPWLDTRFHLPMRNDIDVQLLVGSALFGVGWGLGGFCPGPAIVAAAAGTTTGVVFVGAMIVGMVIQHLMSRR
jgi:uncharacterized membrane protein YedE/YeeE